MKAMHVLGALLAVVALVPRLALGSEALHPTGLLIEDPRTIPWMHEITDVSQLEKGPGGVQTDALVAVNMAGLPPVGNQQTQGSCVGWAMGYYHTTHNEWIDDITRNVNNASDQCSPGFVYNQINGGIDGGAFFGDAMQLICDQGVGSMALMPYIVGNWWNWPSENAYANGIPLRGSSANWINVSNMTGINLVRARIDAGYTTVLGIRVWSNFDNINTFDTTYCVADVYGVDRGNHAVTIIGYDDTKATNDGVGAFRLVNSWGTGWGNGGFWWMSYQAVMNSLTRNQWAYYVTDRADYLPTMVGRVRLTHNDREAMGIRLAVGDYTGATWWFKDFRSWRWNGGTDRAFPANNMVFDMTEGETFISGGQSDSVYVRCLDAESDGISGTINFFSAEDYPLAVNDTSLDTPVSIADFGTPAYAAIQFGLPLVDVGVTSITAPPAVVDSGTPPISPQAVVQNFGIAPATFNVTFRVGSFYTNTQSVVNLGSGSSQLVTFAPWNPVQRGSHTTTCYTALTGDMNTSNDTMTGSVLVNVRDVAMTQIIAPPGVLDSGAPVVPQSVIQNFGNVAATCWVKFLIHGPADQAYEESLFVSVNPGGTQSLAFPGWIAEPPGSFTMESYSTWPTDMVRSNDTIDGSFVVNAPVRDVGVVSIASPGGEYPAGSIVTPGGTWFNYGNITVNFEAWMLLTDPAAGRVYSEMVTVSGLPPGTAAEVSTFPAVVLPTIGSWTAKCSTRVLGDANPVNDTLSRVFTVASRWEEVGCVPTGPSGEAVGRGGWLAHNTYDNLLYVAKGNKTPDFYAFNADNHTWTQLKTLPYMRHPVWARKPPSRGAKGVADGGNYVYATQGNNTLGFWRYDITADSWEVLEDVPYGVSRKKVKGGTDLVYLFINDTGYVYMIKGYKTEFYRYNTRSNEWEGKRDAPTGRRAKWDKGSWLLAEDELAPVLYAHKAKYHELYAYYVDADTWSTDTTFAGMPYIGMMGRRKKSKDGGSAAWYANAIYALKGGNTQEFWKYSVLTNTWNELDTMPSMGYTGKKKRVKYGADIAQVNGRLFALKGNKTCEFWRYSPAPGPMQVPPAPDAPRAGIMTRPAFAPDDRLTVLPNPLAQGRATIRYSLDRPGPAVISVSDIAGRVVLRQTLALEREGATVLDLGRLSSGVYLVHLDCGGQALTRKLVVQ